MSTNKDDHLVTEVVANAIQKLVTDAARLGLDDEARERFYVKRSIQVVMMFAMDIIYQKEGMEGMMKEATQAMRMTAEKNGVALKTQMGYSEDDEKVTH